MARDLDPVTGKWYKDLDAEEVFQVLSVDPDEEILEIQYENGDIEEIDLDTWHELDIDQTEKPEGWAADDDEDEAEDTEIVAAVDEEDDDDDDDWDDDDEDDDDDLDDEDDEYSDRN